MGKISVDRIVENIYANLAKEFNLNEGKTWSQNKEWGDKKGKGGKPQGKMSGNSSKFNKNKVELDEGVQPDNLYSTISAYGNAGELKQQEFRGNYYDAFEFMADDPSMLPSIKQQIKDFGGTILVSAKNPLLIKVLVPATQSNYDSYSDMGDEDDGEGDLGDLDIPKGMEGDDEEDETPVSVGDEDDGEGDKIRL